jgi:hypothetical protein
LAEEAVEWAAGRLRRYGWPKDMTRRKKGGFNRMKKTGTLFVVLFWAGLLLTSESFAQQRVTRNRSGTLGPGNMFDPKTVETIKGEVIRTDEFTLARGMPPGILLIVKTENEVIPVYLGPQWYIENEDFDIGPQDRIEVKGSRITYEGKPAIVASVIFMEDEVLRLRDENGAPVWSVWAPRK